MMRKGKREEWGVQQEERKRVEHTLLPPTFLPSHEYTKKYYIYLSSCILLSIPLFLYSCECEEGIKGREVTPCKKIGRYGFCFVYWVKRVKAFRKKKKKDKDFLLFS